MSAYPAPPDPSNPDLLEGLGNYLETNGLVRTPRVVGTAPPLWIAPKTGLPAAGQTDGLNPTEVGEDLVVGIFPATGIPPARYENFLRQDDVMFRLRASKAYFAISFEQQVRALINDQRNWMMANVPVNESLLVRTLQPLGSDPLGFTFTFEYTFSLWAPEL